MKHFFPNVQHFLEFYFRIRILIGNSSSVYLFLTIFYNKTLRKRKFKMPCFQALGVSAGIAGLRLIALDTATCIEDINTPGWRLHSLKGDHQGLWAIDVNRNWRIVFKFKDGNAYIVDYEDYH